MIDPKDWKWFGKPGYHICSQWCRFHLCTQVGSYLISTVGEYVHPRHSAGKKTTEEEWMNENYPGEDIGLDRKYETTVFRIGKGCCETDRCGCGIPEQDGSEIDMRGYNRAREATEGHNELCNQYAQREDKP